MRRSAPAIPLVCVLALAPLGCSDAGPAAEVDATPRGTTHRVAAPTGRADEDRANVQAAFDSVRAGDVVRFGAGTYRLGEGVTLTVPDVTVLGDAAGGTVLRGCDPEAFEIEEDELLSVVFGCTGFHVRTDRQTIRGLTFEYAWHGIVIGPYPASPEEAAATGGMIPAYATGGHRVEGNTFRATPNGLRILGEGDEISVVRNNDFVDVFHAVGMYGHPVHFIGNRVTVQEPGRVPTSGVPGSAILLSPFHSDCAGHVVAENTVAGYPGAIYVLAPGSLVCRDVEIRDNEIRVARVPLGDGWVIPRTDDDSTLVGVPITLARQDLPVPGIDPGASEGVVEGIVVRGNRVVGAHGIGILVDASHSTIADNVITDVRRRSPFPGINWDPALATWERGNGSGIWVSPGARDNRIAGNEFRRIEGPAITLEGGANEVELAAASDSMLDLAGNTRVSRPPAGR